MLNAADLTLERASTSNYAYHSLESCFVGFFFPNFLIFNPIFYQLLLEQLCFFPATVKYKTAFVYLLVSQSLNHRVRGGNVFEGMQLSLPQPESTKTYNPSQTVEAALSVTDAAFGC